MRVHIAASTCHQEILVRQKFLSLLLLEAVSDESLLLSLVVCTWLDDATKRRTRTKSACLTAGRSQDMHVQDCAVLLHTHAMLKIRMS